MNDTIRDRVARGAKLLDEQCPGWAERISLDWLAMENCEDCILGQLCDDYNNGCEWLAVRTPVFSSSYFGFVLPEEEACSSMRYEALSDAWRAEIRRRIYPAEVTFDAARPERVYL